MGESCLKAFAQLGSQSFQAFDLHAPHLEGYFRWQRGEFRLIALPGGRTRLEGNTSFELELFPQFYWRLFADAIIHRIHRRVLRHVKARVENDIR